MTLIITFYQAMMNCAGVLNSQHVRLNDLSVITSCLASGEASVNFKVIKTALPELVENLLLIFDIYSTKSAFR